MSTNAVALQCVAIPLHGCAPGCGRNYAILPEQRQGLLTPRGPPTPPIHLTAAPRITSRHQGRLFGCMDVLWNCVYTPTALMASTAPSLSPRLHREAPPQQRKVTCCPNRKPLPCHRRCSIPCHMGGP
ncbi:unnamed protein product, partial [Prorocentrum cordatum]